jgi:demethylmenaquinone methyltransferase / 2-methoxy-6-polyprenyl-1,4-benzoquinol methylase
LEECRPCVANRELFGRFAEGFEYYIVPLWGHVYDALIDRSRPLPGSLVLDVGTGTGELAFRAAAAVGPLGGVVAFDTEDGMLRIARKKSAAAGLLNVTFSRMSAERMGLPDRAFDSVMGNYSICCVTDYRAALSECLRVLKDSGKLTFNQSGPTDPPQLAAALEVFERHQMTVPSPRLRAIRRAKALQDEAVRPYRDPSLTLSLMRELGYEGARAASAERAVTYRDAGAFLDRLLMFSWRNEALEIPRQGISKFRAEAGGLFAQGAGGEGFVVREEMVFFSGSRPAGLEPASRQVSQPF